MCSKISLVPNGGKFSEITGYIGPKKVQIQAIFLHPVKQFGSYR